MEKQAKTGDVLEVGIEGVAFGGEGVGHRADGAMLGVGVGRLEQVGG